MKKDNYKQKILSFCAAIKKFYKESKRDFPWRDTYHSYNIVVSEIMLQQTQTDRVLPKYEQFISTFSSFELLAQASLQEVLGLWQGLGYNRRGKALHEIAKKVITLHNGILPDDPEILKTFPGIGPATSCSITAFAFNKPTVFIETNIRAVFIHFFFPDRDDVHDKEIFPLIEATLDKANPRDWYYALMDYGVMLKKQHKNPSRKSVHYAKQSKFEGSDRQIRGAIIKKLTSTESCNIDFLYDQLKINLNSKPDKTRSEKILEQLILEKLIVRKNNLVKIA